MGFNGLTRPRIGMEQNVDELITGSPVSWWTCVKATNGSPNAHSRILLSHRLSDLLLVSLIKTSTPSPKISGDFTFRFLRYLVPVPPSWPRLSYIEPVWLIVTGFRGYTHAVPSSRAFMFACERKLRGERNT